MNNAKVLDLPASAHFQPEQALNQSLKDGFSDVLIVGYDLDGALMIRSSKMSRAEALWLVEQAREWALRGGL